MKNTSINELIILPYSSMLCRYSVNDSESTHTTTYEKISEMILNLCPSVVMRSIPFIEKKLPFYINIKDSEVFELVSSPENIQNNFEKVIRDELKSPITINNNTKKLANCQKNFWRKK